ncbi:MAG: M6 family metalloprotease domain-containing protein [Nitrospina sp.]|nr:M6 family metalloprotease domain-containing protein [Nitrospina sp.]
MKRRILIPLAGLLFSILIPLQVLAVPANPDINPMQQPDGSVFDARLQGDEWNNWIETRDGFTIDRAPDGTWRHVTGFDGNTPQLGASRADKPAPANLKKHLHLDVTPPMNLPGSSSGAPVAPQSAPQGAPFGNFNGPVLFILAEFNDRAGTYSESSWGSFISNNVNDFFSEASYGKVNLTPATETSGVNNNGVIGWVNLGYNHPNTGSSTGTANQQITRDAILAADPFINFASYDTNSDGFVDADELAVVVIVAGYERAYSSAYSPSVWGHKWSIGFFVGAPTVDGVTVGDFHSGEGGYAQFGEIHRSSSSNQHQATMGIMVHELGHLIFGLPDLYDTDGSSSGIGAFGVMGGGSWGKANADPWSGQTPVLPCAWTKLELGWVDQIEGNGAESFTAAGDPGAGPANSVRRASTQVSTQYFLVENRRPVGYDLGLQRWLGTNFGGLAIWHIDDTKSSNSNDANRWVDLEEADGTQMGTGRGSPTDLWYQGNATTFNDGTNPNSKLYSGASSNVDINTISAAGTVMTAAFGSVAPGTLDVSPATDLISSGNEGGPFTPSFIDYTLTNTGGVSINYSVTKSEAWLGVSNASGSLGPGANTTVTVSLSAGANSLTAGAYGDTVTFTNTTNGNGNTTRDVDLTVNAPGAVNAANDFDGDDDSDLLMVDGSGNIVGGILENSIAQSFGFLLTANPAAGWTVNATGDTSGDGKKDLLLYNTTTGEYRVVTLDGASVLTDNVLFTIDPLAGLEPRGTGDFDGDGQDEIIVYQPGTGLVSFVYLAGGAFSSFEIVTQIDEANDWTLVDAADFTGDNKTDLLIQNTVTGETAVIELNGSTPVATTTVFTLDPLLGLTIEDTADFTGDGKTDILMLHTSGVLAVIEMDGLAFQSLYVPGGLAPNWQLVNAGFYDGDNKADFLFHDPATGEVITGIQDGAAITSYSTVLNFGPGSGWTFHKGKP